MRLFAIGDIHLPGGPRAKAMDRFGEVWIDHVRAIEEAWRAEARADDVLLIVGDLSWAMKLEEAEEDLAWIRGLPGRKVVIRGNHDFWWSSIGKVRRALGDGVYALQQDHVVLDGVAIVGTRGWQCPGEVGSADLMEEPAEAPAGGAEGGSSRYTEQDRKIYEREVERLRLGLQNLERAKVPHEKRVVALHYPPMNVAHEPSGFTELLRAHRVDVCVHGHLHGEAAIATAFEGERDGTVFHCVSADAVRMRPRLLLER